MSIPRAKGDVSGALDVWAEEAEGYQSGCCEEKMMSAFDIYTQPQAFTDSVIQKYQLAKHAKRY